MQPGNEEVAAEVRAIADLVRGGMTTDETQLETERRIRSAISADRASRFLSRITSLMGKAALAANAAELLGLAVGAAAVSEAAAIVGAIALAARLVKVSLILGREYRSCTEWRAMNCSNEPDANFNDAGFPGDSGTELDSGRADSGSLDAGPREDGGLSLCDAGGDFMPLRPGATWTYSVVTPTNSYQHELRVTGPGTLGYQITNCAVPSACPGSGTLTSRFALTSQGLEWSPQVGPSPVVFAYPRPPGYRWNCWPFDFHGIANSAGQYLEVVSNTEQLSIGGTAYCAVHYRSASGDIWFAPGIGVVRSTIGYTMELSAHSP